MSSGNTDASDHAEVIRLASVVSEARNEDIPSHLLQMETILKQYPEYSKERQKVKQAILKYDLLSWCAIVLKYDFTKVKGGFGTAASITKILFQCCTGLSLQDSQEFSQTTLPDALQSALMIAWNIQQNILEKSKFIGSIKYGVRADELSFIKARYQSVLDSLVAVTTSHPYLIDTLLKSDNLIRLLVEESETAVELIVMALGMLLRGIRVGHFAIKHLPAAAVNHILDELIYKVTTSQSDELAGVTIKIIVVMVDADPELANKMSVRFKGLKALLTRWMGHGFDHTLQKLIFILDAGNSQIAELARRTHAVKTIWAAYQGWKTRTRLKKLHRVVPSLQSSFRKKRQEKLGVALQQKLSAEQQHMAELEQKRSVRSMREKQLHMLEIVPARKIYRHIQTEEERAATKIQSHWRGSMQRKRFSTQKDFAQVSRAAVVIQRSARRFLARRERMKKGEARPGSSSHHKLTKAKREELQLKINQRQAVRGVKETSISGATKIHDETQRRLQIHHRIKSQISRFEEPKIKALLAKIHTEQELLENIPKLKDATLEEVDNLACSSTAVVMAADREHKRMMKELTAPWWQKLSLKTGENLNPFEDKSKTRLDADLQEIEDFLNPKSNRNVLF